MATCPVSMQILYVSQHTWAQSWANLVPGIGDISGALDNEPLEHRCVAAIRLGSLQNCPAVGADAAGSVVRLLGKSNAEARSVVPSTKRICDISPSMSLERRLGHAY